GNDVRVRQGRGVLLRDGTDLAFVAYGHVVPRALEAAEALARDGISAAVLNARFARPLDGAAIEDLAARLPLLVTVEEHAAAGGFGSAVLEHLAALPAPPACAVRVVGVPDRLVPHGETKDWVRRLGLDAASPAERAK